MKKNLIKLVVAVASVAALAGCGSTSTLPELNGKTVNIYCWNNEFQGRFRSYYPSFCYTDGEGNDILKDGTKVTWTMVANKDNAYQNSLDSALAANETAAADKKVDLFLCEADYALKYVNSDKSLDVKKDIGLDDSDLAGQYKYTQDIMTNQTNGALKGVTWQACPGLFAYRRDIAKSVLGTDDPTSVQAKLADWDKFNSVAKTMKDNNKLMLSGYDDAYRVFSNNISNPLVNSDKEIVIDPAINQWIEQTKDYTTKGYNHGTALWDTQWAADQGPTGNVFGFFYSTWGINFTLAGNALADKEAEAKKGNGLYGEWAVCEGPASYYWGGSWICAAKGTDNVDIDRDIMQFMACDKYTLKKITLDTLDYTNNKEAMNQIAADKTYGSKFLGGQNHIALFAKSADKIDMSNISPYDQGINENIQSAMKDYFAGTVTLDQAWENFYTKIKQVYPDLKKAA